MRPPLARLSPARRRFWLVLVGLVVLVVGGGVVVHVVRNRPAKVTPADQATPGPVLLVPGYGGSTSSLQALADAIARTHRVVEIVPLPGDGTGDLMAQARALDHAAHNVLGGTGASSVDVVGYSAGGVTARLWVKDLDGASLARRVVTVSSPSHGTELAGLAGGVAPEACPTACQQLEPDSELLTRLNADDETPTGPLFTAMWTTSDQTVVPPTSGSLEGAVDFAVQSVCPQLGPVSHGDMPRTPQVIAMIMSELGRARPSVPSSSVCG